MGWVAGWVSDLGFYVPSTTQDHLRVKGRWGWWGGGGGGGRGRKGEENMSNRQLQLYHVVTNVLVKKVERKENKARAG